MLWKKTHKLQIKNVMTKKAFHLKKELGTK